MATVSAHDVAREIRAMIGGVGLFKVHKLLYYCQGWSLALNGEPLFSEEIRAWTNGPVVADLWHAEDKGQPIPAARPLADRQLAVVTFVCGKFRASSGEELKQQTHREAPWCDVIATSDRANPEITLDALREFFTPQVDPSALAILDALPRYTDLRDQQREAMERMGVSPPTPDPDAWFDEELSQLQ